MLHKKVKKLFKKAIPKEIAPFVPAVAGMFLGPMAGSFLGGLGSTLGAKAGILGTLGRTLANPMIAQGLGRGLVDVGAQALTSDRISPASALLSGGLGALSGYQGLPELKQGQIPRFAGSPSKLRIGLDKALKQGAKLGRVGNLGEDFDLLATAKMANVGGTLKAADDELAAQKERAKQLAMESEAFRIGDNAERRQSIISSMLAAGFDRTEAEAAAAEEGYAMGGRVGFDRGGLLRANQALGLFDPRSATRLGGNLVRRDQSGNRVFYGPQSFSDEYQGLDDLGRTLALRTLQGGKGRGRVRANMYGLGPAKKQYGNLPGGRAAFETAKAKLEQQRRADSRAALDAYGLSDVTDTQADALSDALRGFYGGRGPQSFGIEGASGVTGAEAAQAMREARERSTRKFGQFLESNPGLAQTIQSGITNFVRGTAARQMAPQTSPVEDEQDEQVDLFEYAKLAGLPGFEDYSKLAGLQGIMGFEEGGQVGMPERGGGANEEAMADMMMNMESDEFYVDEEGNLRRIPKKRPRQNTRPGMNEEMMFDLMRRMDLNRMGREDGGVMMAMSDPDPMAERSDMLENLSLKYFGKPLDKLSDDEVIELQDLMDDMPLKLNKGGKVPGLPAGRQVDAREGMFIPMGGAKRADDVPAMLSVNEFVLNDDAVAGLGKLMTGNPDPRAGARALYKIQDQLEAMV